MYLVNADKKSILPIEKKTFHELKLKEREHLQEWIAGQPSCLGEKLLIIQKEYDQFEGTKERIDLLALNKQGQLVVSEFHCKWMPRLEKALRGRLAEVNKKFKALPNA